MVFLATGALGTSIFTWGTTKSIFSTMAGFRFLLGVGSGGVYPLYAAKAIEEAGNIDHKMKSLCAAKGFFWRLPGNFRKFYYWGGRYNSIFFFYARDG